MRKYCTILCLFIALLTAVQPAKADLDCGDDVLIQTDGSFTKEKIEKLCGKPTAIKNWKDERFIKYSDNEFVKTTIHYSKWTYNQGSNRLIAYLLFQEDKLIEIKDGDYGSD